MECFELSSYRILKVMKSYDYDDDLSDECGAVGVSTNCYSYADPCHVRHHHRDSQSFSTPKFQFYIEERFPQASRSQLLEKWPVS